MELSGREREQRERVIDFTSEGFRAFFYVVFKPMLDDWRKELCTNTSLTEGEMRGLQHAIIETEAGIERALSAAKIQIPDWLAQELNHVSEPKR